MSINLNAFMFGGQMMEMVENEKAAPYCAKACTPETIIKCWPGQLLLSKSGRPIVFPGELAPIEGYERVEPPTGTPVLLMDLYGSFTPTILS